MKALLFMSAFGAQEIVMLFIILSIFVGIFLAFRAIALWYWKIDTLVKNQEKQINLLIDLISVTRTASKANDLRTNEDKARLFDKQ
jgi:hypothetical protein